MMGKTPSAASQHTKKSWPQTRLPWKMLANSTNILVITFATVGVNLVHKHWDSLRCWGHLQR